jgi:hypothetical protein
MRRAARGGANGRTGATIAACAACVLALAAATGRADDKKKPGLFDFETWKTPVAQDRERARTLAPVELDRTPLGRVEGEPRVLRVRVYADKDYRGLVLRWQDKTQRLLDRVNHVVGPLFGVRFEVESLRDWDRSHTGLGLDPVLSELMALDDAHDVDLVIGLVTPFRGVTTLVHQIAFARYSSRAFVMRAMDDEQEGQELTRAFGLLPPAERDQLYSDRKAHKELVIFLHEWAHTLGALHAEDETLIMNPSTDPRQAAFTEFEKRLIGVVLDRRLGDRTRPFPETADLLRLLDTAPPEEGFAKERATLVQELRARGAGAAPRPSSAAVSTAPVPTSAPGPSGAPSAAASRIADAVARLEANDVVGATPLVLEAARLAGAGPADARTLVQIAQAGGAVGALTAAEGALALAGKNAPRARELMGDLDIARCRDALPRDAAKAGVAPDDEPRYVAAYWLALHAVESLNRAAAERRLAELAAAFPASVGRQVVACELELESKRAAAAQKHCEAAVATFDGTVRAHLDLGRIAARGRHEAEAEKQFRRAVMFDPADDDGWRELGHLFRQTGSSTEHEQLAREHETLFGKPLPE